MRFLLVLLVLLVPLAQAAVRSEGEWRGKVQGLGQSSGDKLPVPARWLLPPHRELLPPRREPLPYLEASLFRQASTTTTTTPSTEGTTTTTTTTEPEAEEFPLPARFPPVWRPSLLGEQLVGSLIRHSAGEELDRSHGQFVDSFIHGQPLAFF
ncbi:uncharacterized protein LOC134541519 [Bacillus rossius redtenbacheri]|uniref:uncharacterized protein LOC134541519 n=1 Tax=Bacillus rossius redtenbacheri TaxID=93214 RepID=UPI002FDCCD73